MMADSEHIAGSRNAIFEGEGEDVDVQDEELEGEEKKKDKCNTLKTLYKYGGYHARLSHARLTNDCQTTSSRMCISIGRA